jgi:hypothetical protein
MANLKITADLRPMAKPRIPRFGLPTTTRLMVCVWLTVHGHTALLEATGGPKKLGFPSATAQEAFGNGSNKSAQNETENSPQNRTGNETARPNPNLPESGGNADSEINALESQTDTKETPGSAPLTVTPQQQKQIDSLIEQLSAPKFSQRETAANQLLQIGFPALASLRKQQELNGEKEAQVRMKELINQLVDGEIEAQIPDFMAMKPVNFEGWREIKLILGSDTVATRALFVEILRSHPTLPTAMQLESTNRDRSIALENVIAAIEKKRFKQMPTAADAFALLLPLTARDFVMPDECEELILGIWQSKTATDLGKNLQLAPCFRYLLGQWITQTSLANRNDILFFGMAWELPQCRILAKNTILNENNSDPTVLAYCLQALAKFGTRSDAAAIRTLLTDKRPASRPSITTQGTLTNQVSDLAIAAIACIYGVELEDVGFTGVRRDPRYGFLPREIGFPKEAPEKRAAAEKMIDAILNAAPPVAPQQRVPPLAP